MCTDIKYIPHAPSTSGINIAEFEQIINGIIVTINIFLGMQEQNTLKIVFD
jgi:hypothetical protein